MVLMSRIGTWFLSVLLVVMGSASQAAGQGATEKTPGLTKLVFSVSWQPGFCAKRPERPECKAQTRDGFESTHFTLHGLWPLGKSYCGVDAVLKAQDRKGKWLELPRPSLAGDVMVTLAAAMPGVKSGLDRHQWLRSGRCHASTAEAYFNQQIRYLDALNRSAVRELFLERLGQMVTEREVRQAFDRTFGQGAGERVRLHCAKAGKAMVVTGLTIGLGEGERSVQVEVNSATEGQGAHKENSSSELPALIHSAAAVSGKCASGLVDRVDGR